MEPILTNPHAKASNPNSKLTHWCFTAWPEDEGAFIDFASWDGCYYGIYQLEKCPDTGKLHFQGFASFNPQKRRKQIVDLLAPYKCHVEGARNPYKAARYCEKEDTRLPGTAVTNYCTLWS